jgi:hypothetical protein
MEGAEICLFVTVSGLFLGPRQRTVKCALGRGYVTTHIYIVPQLRKRGVVPQLLYALLREINLKLHLKILLLS